MVIWVMYCWESSSPFFNLLKKAVANARIGGSRNICARVIELLSIGVTSQLFDKNSAFHSKY